MDSIKGQLTLRGLIVGCIGCIVITAASVYTALKMGALPWPIVFAAIISLFFLKAVSQGSATLNEANVTHTVMSAGAMVAGGLAFTIPGIWMLGYADDMSWVELLTVALLGVVLGLLCTAALRKHFIEESELEYPIGEAAAQTLIAGNSGGRTGAKLFGAMGFAGVYTALRDIAGVIPAMLLSGVNLPGIAFGIYNSPMLLAVGFLVGTGAVAVWFAGAVFANFGMIAGGSAIGLWDVSTAQSLVSSTGMGVMMGAGIGVICKNILPKAIRALKRNSSAASSPRKRNPLSAGCIACAMAAASVLACILLGLNPLAAVITVLLTWVATAMSAQSVGQTGIDPMEIFGLIVLLIVAAFSNTPQVQLFYVAGIVAVACGLAGDVMNDFHAGYVLGTSPRAQWIGQAVGSILGALVSVGVLVILLHAYGPQAFGPHAEFVAAQASVVATLVSGIPHVPTFLLGLTAGLLLYCLGFPAMMLGLGIYLPFYMSFTAFIGAMAKTAYDAAGRRLGRRRPHRSTEERSECDTETKLPSNTQWSEGDTQGASREEAHRETGLVVSSGLLGGESIIGVVSALALLLGNL